MTAEVNGVGDVARPLVRRPVQLRRDARARVGRRPASTRRPDRIGHRRDRLPARGARRRRSAATSAGRRGRPAGRAARRAADARSSSGRDERSPARQVDELTFPALPAGLDTPQVVVDLDRVERTSPGCRTRWTAAGSPSGPHAKTHKSVADRAPAARRGRCRDHGRDASARPRCSLPPGSTTSSSRIRSGPTARRRARIRALHDAAPGLRIGVDSVAGARHLAAAIDAATSPLVVLVEVDPGLHRTGLASPEAAVEVARAARDAGLVVEGVFSHGGHGYGPGRAESAGADEIRTLGEAAAALRRDGFTIDTVSAGSTPTMLTAAGGRRQRDAGRDIRLRRSPAMGARRDPRRRLRARRRGDGRLGPRRPDRPRCRRQGADEGPGRLAHWLRRDRRLPGPRDRAASTTTTASSAAPAGVDRPRLGEVVAIIPNHICPVVDLFDTFVAVTAGAVVGRWPVDARGRSG